MVEIKFQPVAVSEPLSEIKDNVFPFLDEVFFFPLPLSLGLFCPKCTQLQKIDLLLKFFLIH